MCEFPSFLVQRDGTVLFDPAVVSHTALAEKNGVQEDQCIKGDLNEGIQPTWNLSYYSEIVIEQQRYMLFFTKGVAKSVCKMPNSAFRDAENFVKETFYTKKGLRKIIREVWGTRKRKGWKSPKRRVVTLLRTVAEYEPERYQRGAKKGYPKTPTLDVALEFVRTAKFNEPTFSIREE